MVSTEKQFSVLKSAYTELIKNTLILHNVSEVECVNETEHFFDRITIDDGKMKVYKHRFNEPLDGFYFDYTVDYARTLNYIETDLFLVQHGSPSKNGMIFTFNN